MSDGIDGMAGAGTADARYLHSPVGSADRPALHRERLTPILRLMRQGIYR